MPTSITDLTADLSTPELETQLLGLAGHLAAAQCRFLQLLAEFDRRGGWVGPGLKSCAHWLCWRIGMSLRTATEQVRVAHALARLPKVTEAFAAGRISYSKVRAITRIAGRPDPDPTPGATVPGALAPDVPGSAAAGSAAPAPAAADRPADPTTDPTEVPTADPPLADDAEQVLLGIALAGTASHVEKVVRATRRARTDPARSAALRSVGWHHDKDGSLVLRGRFTPDEGALLVATIEALVAEPQPTAHPVPDPPEGWRDTGREQAPGAVDDRLSARRADALIALVTATTQDAGPEIARSRAQVVVHVEADTGAARIENGPEIPKATAERIACDADVRALLHDRRRNRLYLSRRRRLATSSQTAALTVRDGPGCRFPGCGVTRHLHAHHVRHWFQKGETNVDNLVLLCGFHHRLLHDRGYQVRWEAGRWLFARPDGTPVPEAGAPLDGNTESLVELNTRAELRITRDSLTPQWGGERLDLVPILERLLPRSRRTPTAA